jgi:hypothetical protein
MGDDDGNGFYPPDTPDDDRKFVQHKLNVMGLTQSELARRLGELGDYRNHGSILRSIQRVAAGENRLSAELRVILTMLEKDWNRASGYAARASWAEQKSGTLYTAARDFDSYLIPKPAGRWKVHLSHQPSKYSPSWMTWDDLLAVAKVRAFVQLDDTWLDPDWQDTISQPMS